MFTCCFVNFFINDISFVLTESFLEGTLTFANVLYITFVTCNTVQYILGLTIHFSVDFYSMIWSSWLHKSAFLYKRADGTFIAPAHSWNNSFWSFLSCCGYFWPDNFVSDVLGSLIRYQGRQREYFPEVWVTVYHCPPVFLNYAWERW